MAQRRISGPWRVFCTTLILNFGPQEHCRKAPELLRAGGADEALIHAVCSHGYGHLQ